LSHKLARNWTVETGTKSYKIYIKNYRLKKYHFFPAPFFIAVFFRKRFSLNFKPYSNSPVYTNACGKKLGWGRGYGEIFLSLKSAKTSSPEIVAREV
jgi:hypothetical protein